MIGCILFYIVDEDRVKIVKSFKFVNKFNSMIDIEFRVNYLG